jgi:hypothetical protein
MRTIVMSILALAIYSLNLMAVQAAIDPGRQKKGDAALFAAPEMSCVSFLLPGDPGVVLLRKRVGAGVAPAEPAAAPDPAA